MIFVDGTWLYANTGRLSEVYGKDDFHVDFGRLPRVLAEEVATQLGATEMDVVRTYLFGSYAGNYDIKDDDLVQRRLDFFSMLKEEYHYELEIFPVNFRGRRVRKVDRDPADQFEPKEKCVDISLATSMLYFAAIPYAYDIAIAVIGDQDFKPVLQHVRRLGKRVAIASIKDSCSPEFADPKDEARVKDFDIIWLDDLLHKLELKYERHQLECQSASHRGDRRVWTTYHPRKSEKFYCDACRAEFARQKYEAAREHVSVVVETVERPEAVAPVVSDQVLGKVMTGVIKRKVSDRGFGFIRSADSTDYFFHFTDLAAGIDFQDLAEGEAVEFEVKRAPTEGKNGSAYRVARPARPSGGSSLVV
jgi:cold shock CspA family protein